MVNINMNIEKLKNQIFASSIGSITATMTLNPIGVLKVRAQAGQGNLSQIIKSILNESGILGFWTGARLGVIQSLPSTILYMTSYENFRDILLESLSSDKQFLAPGIAGGFARTAVVTALAPIEIVRMLQLGGSNQTMFEIVREIYTKSGIKGFYRGWSSSIMRDTPFSVVYWMCFDQLRNIYRPLIGDSNNSSPIVNFLSGSSSGTIAAIFTHPFDVLKTQHQLSIKEGLVKNIAPPIEISSSLSSPLALVQGKSEREVCSVISECCCPCTCRIESPEPIKQPQLQQQYKPKLNIRDGIKNIIRTRGPMGLFTGLTMRLATIIPGSGIMITTYEFAKSLHLQ